MIKKIIQFSLCLQNSKRAAAFVRVITILAGIQYSDSLHAQYYSYPSLRPIVITPTTAPKPSNPYIAAQSKPDLSGENQRVRYYVSKGYSLLKAKALWEQESREMDRRNRERYRWPQHGYRSH